MTSSDATTPVLASPDEVSASAGLSPDRLRQMLYTMYLIRAFEEEAEQLYIRGKVHGTMHLSVGQEAVAVGAMAALEPDDYILSTHRGHGHSIAKGADVKRMMAEFLGKETGYCRGRGGSMHIADIDSGNLGANGIVAGGMPLAVGVGLSIQMRRTGQVILCFFGDGAASEGAFHESLNLAAIWKLPVVFLCENNQYAMSLPVEKAMLVHDIADRGAAYGIPGGVVDGNDVFAVWEATVAAVDRARRGEGPSLVEAKTYRWKGHSKSDQQRYRSREEVEAWKARDPVARLRQHLVGADFLTGAEAEELAIRARQAIQEAVAFAEASPDPSVDEIMEGVYA